MENTTIRFGSVCSGIEAASVAWNPLGWEAAWFSEIDAFPSAVLAHHYPDVPNLGDMATLPELIRNGEVKAPDILCGGTPCQAFSVAGNRQSLSDERGNLTLVFCEIANAIDDVRRDAGLQPAVVFWENVPGVLNTKDNAFGCFLGELAGEDRPLEPAGKKWTNAGCVFGPKRAIAWRILDAQYFGVAQRRRRVFVVASARDGFDPTEILFEFEGMRRDSPPSREAGQGFAADVAPGATGAGGGVGCWWDGGQVSQTLDAVLAKGQTMPEKNRFPADLQPVAFQPGNLTRGAGSAPSTEVFPTLKSDHGRGRSDQDPHVAVAFDSRQDPVSSEHVFGALNSSTPQAQAVAIRTANTGANGHGISPELAHTLDLAQGQAVAVSLRGREGGATAELGDEISNCLRASGGGGDKQHVLVSSFQTSGYGASVDPHVAATMQASYARLSNQVYGVIQGTACNRSARGVDLRNGAITGDITQTLQSHHKSNSLNAEPTLLVNMAVRRLTPIECERLQGFPDGWTDVPYRNKPAADGPRYKALGNSWAVPVVRWIGERIDAALRGAA